MAYKSSLLNTSLLSNNSSISSQTNANIPSLMLVNPDTEPIIEIDADNRKIIVPQELFNIAVCGDHLSEEILFKISRYFDGEDLSAHTCVIRGINAGNEYFEYNQNDENIRIVELGDEDITFGWDIDNYATRYKGIINFTVQFETVSNNGVEYQWQTTPAQLNILAGLNIEETITDKDDSLFRSLSNQVQDLQKSVEGLTENVTTLNELIAKVEKLTSDVEYLKNNVVYVLSDV